MNLLVLLQLLLFLIKSFLLRWKKNINLELYCVTNKRTKFLENSNYKLGGGFRESPKKLFKM